ncbi:MAG: hypothetical protein GQ580_00055 [Candidatus Thorarchaeota archaeon]|nr:hypothetical protein [Candidatus Thorarchaeota archaeon]
MSQKRGGIAVKVFTPAGDCVLGQLSWNEIGPHITLESGELFSSETKDYSSHRPSGHKDECNRTQEAVSDQEGIGRTVKGGLVRGAIWQSLMGLEHTPSTFSL